MKSVSFFAAAIAFGSIAPAQPPPQRTELHAEYSELVTVGNETRLVCKRGKDEQVTLTGTNLKITCDQLEAIATGVDDRTSIAPVVDKFKYLLAIGNVVIVQGDREARCGRAEVFPADGKLELTEKPMVIDHGSGFEQNGAKITMFRNERKVVVDQSIVTGPSLRDLGFDPNQPAPAPSVAPGSAAPSGSSPPK